MSISSDYSQFQPLPDKLTQECKVSTQTAQHFFQEVSYYGNSGSQPSTAEEAQFHQVWNDLQNSHGPDGLALVGQDLLKLEKIAGGPNSQNFQADLGAIGDIHTDGLPPIAIVGVTDQGQLVLDEYVNGSIKTTVGDNNVGATMNSENLISQLSAAAQGNDKQHFNELIKQLEQNDSGKGGDDFALDLKVLAQQIYQAENPTELNPIDPVLPIDRRHPLPGPKPIGPIIWQHGPNPPMQLLADT
jgi:hypothetical protein